MGLSFTRPQQEVFYISVSGIRARATTSKVRHTLELEIRNIQARPIARSNIVGVDGKSGLCLFS